MPPPVPPRVKAGLRIAGNPICSIILMPSSILVTATLSGTSRCIFFIASLKSSLSSAFFIADNLAPISSTPYLSKTPDSDNSTVKFNAVCPPIVGRTASGLSFLIISSKISADKGSIYVASAISGSVIMVAGFEFTRTIL